MGQGGLHLFHASGIEGRGDREVPFRGFQQFAVGPRIQNLVAVVVNQAADQNGLYAGQIGGAEQL